MNYQIIPLKIFLSQFNLLSEESAKILLQKIDLLKINPYRNKQIKGHILLLFRIRFSDRRKAKRAVYHVDADTVFLICIIDRDDNYNGLKQYLKALN